jgi:hypothetical protein
MQDPFKLAKEFNEPAKWVFYNSRFWEPGEKSYVMVPHEETKAIVMKWLRDRADRNSITTIITRRTVNDTIAALKALTLVRGSLPALKVGVA